MIMYQPKNLDCGFIILSCEPNIALLQSTAISLQNRYPNFDFINVASNSCNDEDVAEQNRICKTVKGNSSFSSLINTGMKHTESNWNFIILSGVSVRPRMDIKFSTFIENKKDILYPVIGNKMEFMDSSLNGLLIHKDTFSEIGDMGEDGPLNIVKLLWGSKAIECGCKFKGIVGTRFC